MPAGAVSWHAAAAPLPQPWPADVAALVEQRSELVNQASLAEMHFSAVAALAAGEEISQEEKDRQFDRWKAALERRVVAVHRGHGQFAGTGFVAPAFEAGFLLVYADGGCGFAWGEALPRCTLIDYFRLELDDTAAAAAAQ